MPQDLNDLNLRVADKQAGRSADIAQNIRGREALLKKVYIDLTTAQSSSNAKKISIPFKSVSVEGATDSSTNLFMALGDNSLDAVNDAKQLKSNDSFEFDSMVSSCYLYWTAQSGKSLYLVFSTTGAFRPGSQISVISGGINITEGDALSSTLLTGGLPTIAVTSRVKILDQDTSRKNFVGYTDAEI